MQQDLYTVWLRAWVRRDRGRPLRALFATCEPSLAQGVRITLEHLAKRPVTLVEHLDLADLAADARQFGCDMIFIWCNGVVGDRERLSKASWRDYLPRAAQLHQEFPTVPVILVSSNYGPDFPERVAEAGAHLLTTPFTFAELEKCVGIDRPE